VDSKEPISTCPMRCGMITTAKCTWCGDRYLDGIKISPGALLPRELSKGMIFRLRKTTNARKFTVTGLVLKITRENGFKYIAPEEAGKIKVPCDAPAGELLLDPDKEIYLIR
jgi:hypothetical protein